MILEIIQYPDPRLREVSAPVSPEEIQKIEFQKLLQDLFDTMYDAPGIGLAAVQVGVLKRVMVMDVGIEEGEVIRRDQHVVINPEFILKEGSVVWEEGCLSCPDIIVPVKRSREIGIRFLNEKGEVKEFFGEELVAVAIQHEMDHMDGKLILDYLSRLKRNLYTEKAQKGKIAIR